MDAIALMNEIRNRLLTKAGRYIAVSKYNPKLGYSWMLKFARGDITNPRVKTLQALIVALDKLEAHDATHPRRIRKKRKTRYVRKRPYPP